MHTQQTGSFFYMAFQSHLMTLPEFSQRFHPLWELMSKQDQLSHRGNSVEVTGCLTCRRGAVGPASMHFYRALAEKKLSRFKQFAAIYPECCWVFVGDNGQVSDHQCHVSGDIHSLVQITTICHSCRAKNAVQIAFSGLYSGKYVRGRAAIRIKCLAQQPTN